MILGTLSASRPAPSLGTALALAVAGGAVIGGAASSWIAHGEGTAAPPPVRMPQPEPQRASDTRYPAVVLEVIDGDTFLARVRIWPDLDVTTKVRLRGVDAPERHARCPREQALAEAARDRLAAILAEGEVGVGRVGRDKYGGRVLASASTPSTADVSAALIAAGVARPYTGGRRAPWCGGA
jgi:endonuclease YncB( thermonuclease family)